MFIKNFHQKLSSEIIILVVLVIIVIKVNKVIMELMLKVVIKEWCVFKKWPRCWIVIGQYHV